jgi:transcriptional regulator with XRE-family HTH domain
MTISERIKEVRRGTRLSQAAFGEKLGVSRDVINDVENGRVSPKELFIKHLCSVCNINEAWLRTGDGEKQLEDNESILSSLVDQYHLDDLDAKILETYIKLPNGHRQAVKDFVCNLADAVRSGAVSTVDEFVKPNTPPTPPRLPQSGASDMEIADLDIDAEVESYRRELEEEKRAAAKSLVSGEQDGNMKEEKNA